MNSGALIKYQYIVPNPSTALIISACQIIVIDTAVIYKII